MRFSCSWKVVATTLLVVLTTVTTVAVAFSLTSGSSSSSSSSRSLRRSHNEHSSEEEKEADGKKGASSSSSSSSSSSGKGEEMTSQPQQQQQKDSIRVAFLGNSILYFNDCPRLVQHMLKTMFRQVLQDSCLRPNASLASLWTDGNGMYDEKRFHPAVAACGAAVKAAAAADTKSNTNDNDMSQAQPEDHDWGSRTVVGLLSKEKHWDFVVMNDHTRAPVREASKHITKQALSDHYADLLLSLSSEKESDSTASVCEVVLLQTAAYREPKINDSADCGDLPEFSSRLQIGYREYAQFLKTLGIPCRIAPFGQAMRYLNSHDHELWLKCFSWDGFHPSPHGTWFMACVLYITMVRDTPPMYQAEWFQTCRYFHTSPRHPVPLPLPTNEEALELRRVAIVVCGSSASASAGTTQDKKSML